MASSENNSIDILTPGWDRITTRLKLQLGQTTFAFWLGTLHLIAASRGKVVLGIANRFERDRVSEMYGSLIAELVAAEWPDFGPIVFEIAPQPRDLAPTRVLAVESDLPAPALVAGSIPLNRAHSFENFVTGRPNEVAVAQARQFADDDGHATTLLFLFGATGLGKSHLAQAIALRALDRNPKTRVLYITAEWFVTNFIAAVRSGDTTAFKALVRDVDLLVVDDLHIIAGKERSTDEFMQTFDAVIDAGKKIVLTADRSPALFEQLSDRARSRLLKGTSVEIKSNDFDLRLAILEAKVARLRQSRPAFTVGSEALRFMAQRINANTRELEGALFRVLSHSGDGTPPVTLANLQLWLQDFLKVHDRRVTVEEVKVKTAAFFGCRVSDLELDSRARDIVRPRQIAMLMARRLTSKSLPDIARRFKRKDHTTVIHAIKKIEAMAASDPEFARSLEALRLSIRNWPNDDPPPSATA